MAFAVGCGTGGTICPQLWRTLATTGQLANPVIANGRVYVGSADGRLHAYDASGCGSPPCAEIWSSADIGTPVTTEPAVWRGQVYVAAGGQLQNYPADGCVFSPCDPVAYIHPNTTVVGSPTAVAGTVYLPGANNHPNFSLWAMDADACAAGTCVDPWLSALNSSISGPVAGVAVADGRLHMANADRVLRSIDAGGCDGVSCAFDWTDGPISASPIAPNAPAVADGVVYVTFADGSVRAFAADGCGASACTALWKVNLSAQSPLRADRRGWHAARHR